MSEFTLEKCEFTLEKFRKTIEILDEEMERERSEGKCIWLRIKDGEFVAGTQSYGSAARGRIEKMWQGYVEFLNNKPVRRFDIDNDEAEKLGLKFKVIIKFRMDDQLLGFTVPDNSIIDSLAPYLNTLRVQGLSEYEVTTSFVASQVKSGKYLYNRVAFTRVPD